VRATTLFTLAVSAAFSMLLCGCAGSGDAPGLVTGQVLAAPSCPVERVGQECPPRPVSGASVVAVDGTSVRGSTLTDSAGAFQLTLPYGHYEIRATNVGGYTSTDSAQVSISRVPVRITLLLDSGIR